MQAAGVCAEHVAQAFQRRETSAPPSEFALRKAIYMYHLFVFVFYLVATFASVQRSSTALVSSLYGCSLGLTSLVPLSVFILPHQECPANASSFRDLQCAAFNAVGPSQTQYTWSSVQSRKRPASVLFKFMWAHHHPFDSSPCRFLSTDVCAKWGVRPAKHRSSRWYGMPVSHRRGRIMRRWKLHGEVARGGGGGGGGGAAGKIDRVI